MAKHLLLDLRGCNSEVLDNLELLKWVLYSIAQDSILAESFYRFQPQGISGIIWTKGLRLYIHTWPEYNYAAIDVLIYDDDIKIETIARTLMDKLGTKKPIIHKIKR